MVINETADDSAALIGTVIDGRYVLRRVLGRGAAACVFAAEHLVVRRPVAIKLAHADAARRESRYARLRRETEALSRVRHLSIVDAIDAGESDGAPFLVMPLLEGRTLSGLITSRGRLDPEEVIKLGVELAHGLGAVHRAGLI